MLKLLTFVLLIMACTSAVGQSGVTYTELPDAPAPCFGGDRANGINPKGDIVGRCMDSIGPRSWILTKGSTTPVLIDFSGAPFNASQGSTTRAINARGDIVGRYFDA